MKRIVAVLLLLGSVAANAAGAPTPESALSFEMGRDAREWTPQHQDGSELGVLLAFVPAGDSITSWKEMVAQQIVFITPPLRDYVATWKGLLLEFDPEIVLREESLEDGSVLVTYTSLKGDETSMRRFIQDRDGIYMLAYHVRPKLRNEAVFTIWNDIIRGATLIPNPEKTK